MSTPQIDLASLLCSRLCHDLLSPVGAMNNGLELLEDESDPEMRKRCLDLLASSARITAQKLKYFRLAFGAAGGFADLVDSNEPRGLIEGLVAENRRISLVWEVQSAEMPKAAVKILLNLALIGINALVRGGDLTIGEEHNQQKCEIVVRAGGTKVVIDQNIAKALTGKLPEAELGSRTAAAWMVDQLAGQYNGQVQLIHQPNMLILGASLWL